MKLTAFTIAASFLCLIGCQSNNEEPASVAETPAQTESVAESKVVLFGLYTADKASTVVEEFAPTIDSLEKSVNEKLEEPIEIQFKIANEYQQGISQIADGTVHFSRLGPASFVLSKEQNPDLQLLAMESKKGERVFNGIIAIHADSDIETVEGLAGKSFAFGDELSTIGRYLSQALLLEAGLSSDKFEKYEFLGRHDTVGMAVAAGDFTAGALKESTFKKLVEDGQPIKALTKFDNVTKPWVAHQSLDSKIVEAISQSLLEMESSSVSKDGFLTATEAHYAPVREAMTASKKF